MSKLAIICDTHAGARGDSAIFHDYFKVFFDTIFFPTIDSERIKTIIHLGDVVDRRKYIQFATLNRLKKDFIDPIKSRGIDLHILCGNHDTPFKNSSVINALTEAIQDGTGFPKVYTNPQEVRIDGLDILFLPWINAANLEASEHLIATSTCKVVMGHLEIMGASMDRSNVSPVGYEPDMFSRFSLVLSGHFHTKTTSGVIAYLGAPYEMTFGDLGDPRGFHIFDTETLELRYVQNPVRMFHRIYYDDRDKTLDEIMQVPAWNQYNQRYVKVIVIAKTNPFFFDKFYDKLYDCDPANVTIVEDFVTEDTTEDVVDMAEDTLTMIAAYVDGLDIDADKTVVKEWMRKLYVEATVEGVGQQ